MDYSLIVALLAFFGAVQLCSKLNTGPIVNSLVAVGIPFVLTLVLKCIYLMSYQLPLQNLFSVAFIITLLFQFVASIFIFRKLQDEEGYGEWFGWVIGGGITLIFVIPFIVQNVVSMLMH